MPTAARLSALALGLLTLAPAAADAQIVRPNPRPPVNPNPPIFRPPPANPNPNPLFRPPPGNPNPPPNANRPQPQPPNYATKPPDTTYVNSKGQTVRRRWVWDGYQWRSIEETLAGQPQLMDANRPNGPRPPVGPNGPYPEFRPGPLVTPTQPGVFYPPTPQPDPVVTSRPAFEPATPPPAVPTETALLVTDLPDGPAKRAGLATGDIIIRAGGVRTTSLDVLRTTLRGTSTSSVTYYRPSTGQVYTADVEVEDGRIGVIVDQTNVRFGQ